MCFVWSLLIGDCSPHTKGAVGTGRRCLASQLPAAGSAAGINTRERPHRENPTGSFWRYVKRWLWAEALRTNGRPGACAQVVRVVHETPRHPRLETSVDTLGASSRRVSSSEAGETATRLSWCLRVCAIARPRLQSLDTNLEPLK